MSLEERASYTKNEAQNNIPCKVQNCIQQHIYQQVDGTQDQSEGPCLMAAVEGQPSPHSVVPCYRNIGKTFFFGGDNIK